MRLALEIIFEGVQGASDVGTVQGASAAGDVLRIADMLTLTHQPASAQGSSGSLILEWEGGPMGDMLADAITAVILQVPTPTTSLASALVAHDILHGMAVQLFTYRSSIDCVPHLVGAA